MRRGEHMHAEWGQCRVLTWPCCGTRGVIRLVEPPLLSRCERLGMTAAEPAPLLDNCPVRAERLGSVPSRNVEHIEGPSSHAASIATTSSNSADSA